MHFLLYATNSEKMKAIGRRGISPITTTVAMIGISIAIAIASAVWLEGVIQPFFRIEKLEMSRPYAVYYGSNGSWTIRTTIMNKGTCDTRLVSIALNGVACDSSGAFTTRSKISSAPVQMIAMGQSVSFTIILKEGDVIGGKRLFSGTTVFLTFQTDSCNYPAMVDI